MNNAEYKTQQVQKVIDDLQSNFKHIGSIKINGWSLSSKTLNVSLSQLEAIRDIFKEEK